MSRTDDAPRLTVLVTGDPWTSRAHASAQRFVEAAATLNAAIEQVFFYQNAVLIAAVGIRARTPSENLAARWLELSDRLHVPLRVCQSAAMRRGVISDSEADVRHLPRGNWQRGFEEASLADLSEACARPNTKLIQFRG